jgi:hypothetical protein
MEKASGVPVTIETAILQRVLEAHVRDQLTALADLRVSLARHALTPVAIQSISG